MVSHRRFGRSNRDRIVRISNLIGQTFHRNFSNTFVFELHGEVLYINLRTWSRSKNVQQFCLRYSCRQPRYFIPLVHQSCHHNVRGCMFFPSVFPPHSISDDFRSNRFCAIVPSVVPQNFKETRLNTIHFLQLPILKWVLPFHQRSRHVECFVKVSHI